MRPGAQGHGNTGGNHLHPGRTQDLVPGDSQYPVSRYALRCPEKEPSPWPEPSVGCGFHTALTPWETGEIGEERPEQRDGTFGNAVGSSRMQHGRGSSQLPGVLKVWGEVLSLPLHTGRPSGLKTVAQAAACPPPQNHDKDGEVSKQLCAWNFREVALEPSFTALGRARPQTERP